MQTANNALSFFLKKNAEFILQACLKEGFTFHAKEGVRSVTVRCTLPDGSIRFVIFDDHRIENPHGKKPHVCNQWHKAVGDPISFTTGKEIVDETLLHRILLATSIMCITQSDGYAEFKNTIFSNHISH